jgi:arsenate reductase-like glutaredoxin family protein
MLSKSITPVTLVVVTIQVIGIKGDFTTQKALRFFKERNITPQFRDLKVKGLSAGELENICRSVDPSDLIDPESNEYRKHGYAYREFDPLEEIEENPMLMKMPVVRSGGRAAVGFRPEIWEEWIE